MIAASDEAQNLLLLSAARLAHQSGHLLPVNGLGRRFRAVEDFTWLCQSHP